jgi:hypothetical protein
MCLSARRKLAGYFFACRKFGQEEEMTDFVPFGSDEEVIAIARGFEARTLPKEQWTHAAHFATALWLMTCRPDIDPEQQMPGMIRAYNESIGGQNTDTSGYHETITQASLRTARAFLALHTGMQLHAICNELMASPLGRSDWLLEYWSKERLFSVEARTGWVEPDLKVPKW